MPPSQLKQLKASIHERRHGPKDPRPLKPPLRQQPLQKRPKSQGEEARRLILLPELQRRHKVGGIIDRRIGENDPTLAPEDRALQRYARQKSKRNTTFNLENGAEDDQLTHLGLSIVTDPPNHVQDDFDVDGLDDASDHGDELFTRPAKRRRLSDDEEEAARGFEASGEPERKKTKKEVMEEVIAKSKLYKYERQQAREEDDELREELDKELPELLATLRGDRLMAAPPPIENHSSSIHPDRAAQMVDGIDGTVKMAEKDYDKSLRQLALDRRAQPTERTKTDEEKANAEQLRRKELEEKRQRRMRGEEETSDSEVEEKEVENPVDGDLEYNEAAEFGLVDEPQHKSLDVEDEDDFIIDDDLVASGSNVDSESDVSDEIEAIEEQRPDADEDFLQDVLGDERSSRDDTAVTPRSGECNIASSLSYTYACPRDHAQLVKVLQATAITDLPIIIQRIRALHHPQLHAENKEKLSDFAVSLVNHLCYMGSQNPPLPVVEAVIRHLHSLSRIYPMAIANAFRSQLQRIHDSRSLDPGDLFIMTAIGSIYPTSDHFHQVVTPAILIMARWLGTITPSTVKESAIGAYVVALCVKYQLLAKRYIPEAVRFTVAALRKDIDSSTTYNHVKNLVSMMDLWADTPAFTEVFSPSAQQVLETINSTRPLQKLKILLSQARLRRRPLELHHHRPLPIKSSVPKFEDSFNPEKHYDPDRERAEASKLRAEYKRERKGALRELRKDASFLAREKLKRKKEADQVYETKQRRLIAEIQGEEGKEKNAYDRQKKARKGRR